jgi:nucleoside-diphosphate-sugar epimerase
MLYSSSVWKKDLDTALSILSELSGKAPCSVLVTGSTGLIGTAVVHLLLRFNDTSDRKIDVLATGRTLERVKEHYSDLLDRDDLFFAPFDAADPDLSGFKDIDYIIHAASPASPDAIVKNPVETFESNTVGLKALLSFSRDNGVKRLLFVSSSEVYGKTSQDTPSKEDEYGFIDPLLPRNSYSIGKRAGENLCASFLSEYEVDSVIVRPGHIYGPTAAPSDIRVSSSWAYDAAKGRDIVMKSSGEQIRSYCYCLDCATAIMKVLFDGRSGEAYNISNRDSIMSIAELADTISSVSGVSLIKDIPTEEERKAFNPMKNSSLDSNKLESLGWKGLFDGKTGVSHTIGILREVNGFDQ